MLREKNRGLQRANKENGNKISRQSTCHKPNSDRTMTWPLTHLTSESSLPYPPPPYPDPRKVWYWMVVPTLKLSIWPGFSNGAAYFSKPVDLNRCSGQRLDWSFIDAAATRIPEPLFDQVNMSITCVPMSPYLDHGKGFCPGQVVSLHIWSKTRVGPISTNIQPQFGHLADLNIETLSALYLFIKY